MMIQKIKAHIKLIFYPERTFRVVVDGDGDWAKHTFLFDSEIQGATSSFNDRGINAKIEINCLNNPWTKEFSEAWNALPRTFLKESCRSSQKYQKPRSRLVVFLRRLIGCLRAAYDLEANNRRSL